MTVFIKTRTGKTGRRYLVYYRLGGRAHREVYAGSYTTQREAKIRRDLIAGELAAGRDPRILLQTLAVAPTVPDGLEQIWTRFIDSRVDVGDKAHAQYRNARDRWLPLLGRTRDPATIAATDVVAGIAEMYDEGEGLSSGTLGQYRAVLAMVLDYADVEPNPARSAKVKLPSGSTAERAIPDHKTWQAIHDHVKKRSLLTLRLMEACAFRVSEACGIEEGDVDFVHGQIRVRRDNTKTGAGRRWVPVPPKLLDELDRLVPPEDRQPGRKLLGVKSSIVYTDLVKACVQAGAPEFGTHALRHRRISLLIRHGIDVVQVADWVGHSKPSESTDTYGHVIVDPAADEWRGFWLAAYARHARPGAAPVRHQDTEKASFSHG